MHIAMIGQKGLPAAHGGVERHVQELSVRLVERGHKVTVYNRRSYSRRGLTDYRGVHVVDLPSLATKHLDTITHVALCTAHAMRSKPDILHYHAIGPALLSWAPRLQGTRVVATVHGQDWQRPKWGAIASTALRCGEWVAMHAPHATIVVSQSLARRLSQQYGRPTQYIPNGVSLEDGDDPAVLAELGVDPTQYVLFASRLVPEKGAHLLIAAHELARTDLPLVIAGDSSFSSDYVRELRELATGKRVHFAGYVYGSRLASLFRNAALFVLPSDVEGLPIVLLEALGYGTPVLASDIAPNREVLAGLGRAFRAGDVGDLAHELSACLADLPALRQQASAASAAVHARYDWDVVADQTIAVYEMVRASGGGRAHKAAWGPSRTG